MGESSKFPKSQNFETPFIKFVVCPLNIHNFKFKWSNVLRQTENKSEKLLWSPKFSGYCKFGNFCNSFQGYRLSLFRQEQAGPLKQNDWGPSPKLRGPGFGRKLN